MRVLIAEDDKALGMFLSRGLEADGHRVQLVFDGAAAVEAFRRELPDLTILDLNLPVKDGEQALVEMRALEADLPVLILTARQEVETRVRCLDQNLEITSGPAPFSLPLALNEPVGTWALLATDAATGVQGKATVKVASG